MECSRITGHNYNTSLTSVPAHAEATRAALGLEGDAGVTALEGEGDATGLEGNGEGVGLDGVIGTDGGTDSPMIRMRLFAASAI